MSINKGKLFLLYILLIIFLPVYSVPDWVKNRPIDELYFIGIGQASTKDQNYCERAKEQAFHEIATQIEVKVNYSAKSFITENLGKIYDNYSSETNLASSVDLKDIEIYDSCIKNKVYYVYCRILKNQYYENRKLCLSKAQKQCFDLLKTAQTEMNNGNLLFSIQNYIKSLDVVIPFLGEIEVKHSDGQNSFIENDIANEIFNSLSSIDIIVLPIRDSIPAGLVINKKLSFSIRNKKNVKQNYSNLPYSLYFLNDTISMTKYVRTNENGTGECVISKLDNFQPFQDLEIKLTVDSLFLPSNSNQVRTFIKSIPIPSKRISLYIRRPKFFINISEKYENYQSESDPILRPTLIETFYKEGYRAANKNSECDIIVNLSSRSRAGSSVGSTGMVSAFVDLDFWIYYEKDKREIYREQFSQKGVGRNQAAATRKAILNISEEIRNKIPIIIQTKQF